MKFRKKPVVIEASLFMPTVRPWPEGVYAKTKGDLDSFIYMIDTLEGDKHIVSPGDWIITGIKGEKYPIKNDIFLETYEKEAPNANKD